MKSILLFLAIAAGLAACGSTTTETVSRDLQASCGAGNIEACQSIALSTYKQRYGG